MRNTENFDDFESPGYLEQLSRSDLDHYVTCYQAEWNEDHPQVHRKKWRPRDRGRKRYAE
jgi:hypothetical protein